MSQSCVPCQPCAPIPLTGAVTQFTAARVPQNPHSPKTFPELHYALSHPGEYENNTIVLTQNITEPPGYNWQTITIAPTMNIVLEGGNFSIGDESDTSRQVNKPMFNQTEAGGKLTVRNVRLFVHMPELFTDTELHIIGGFARAIKGGSFVCCAAAGIIEQPNSDQVGGFVGLADSNTRFDSCANYVTIRARRRVGGIVGQTGDGPLTPPSSPGYAAVLTECSNYANLFSREMPEWVPASGERYSNIGGIVGFANQTEISCCQNLGNVTAMEKNSGGIAGEISICRILRCSNKGEIYSFVEEVGGIAGKTNKNGPSTIFSCVNNGLVYANGGQRRQSTGGPLAIGGIIGLLRSGCKIERCQNTGDINYHDGEPCADCESCGGIAGGLDTANPDDAYGWPLAGTTITECSNSGNVYGAKSIGGIVGYAVCSQARGYITSNTNSGNVVGVATWNTAYGVFDNATAIGGIVGMITNAATVARNAVLKPCVVSGMRFLGGVAGVVNDIDNAAGANQRQLQAVIAHNSVDAISVLVADPESWETTGRAGYPARRILGYMGYQPPPPPEIRDTDLLLYDNWADPQVILNAWNAWATNGYDYDEWMDSYGLDYAHEPVKLEDPDYGVNRLNGGNRAIAKAVESNMPVLNICCESNYQEIGVNKPGTVMVRCDPPPAPYVPWWQYKPNTEWPNRGNHCHCCPENCGN